MNNLTPDTTLALLGSNNVQTNKALDTLKTASDQKRLEKLESAAEDFEAVFLAEMMKPMFETIGVNETFGGGKGEEIFRSFLTQEYGKILAGTGTVGITEQVRETLIKIQEGDTPSAKRDQNGTPIAVVKTDQTDKG